MVCVCFCYFWAFSFVGSLCDTRVTKVTAESGEFNFNLFVGRFKMNDNTSDSFGKRLMILVGRYLYYMS